MNKQIKELAIKAGLDITLLADAEKVEDFAKMIADMCMQICRDRTIRIVEGQIQEHHVIHNNAVYCCYSDIEREFE